MNAILARHGWLFGLLMLLVALFAATLFIQPDFGASGLESIARAALPFAFATAGMAIVVIAGGIDLSIAAIMAVTSVTAAVLMQQTGEGGAVLVVIGVLGLGAIIGATNGVLITITRVPDIVVTLAMLFVWEGVALLILNSPGGASAQWLRSLSNGSPFGIWPASLIPGAFILMAICIAIIWIPLKRSRLGLSIYAIGSDPVAAFRSGISIGKTRIAAYALAGVFAAMGGLSLTMQTGIGEPIPGPYLLASVAAVVLGGVALGGGVGGLLGPIIAVLILRLVRMDLTLLAVDPNITTIIEGSIMVAVVMLGGYLAIRGRRR